MRSGPHPVIQIALGLVIGLIAMGIPFACGGSSLPGVVQCQLDALKVLPQDSMNATVYDAVDVIERVRACRAEHADAGTR